jgi:hypothetical protein
VQPRSHQPRQHLTFHRTLYSVNMNWTGGTLQRTKHANKGITQKQKAYFARARTHLQNGSSHQLFRFGPATCRTTTASSSPGICPRLDQGRSVTLDTRPGTGMIQLIVGCCQIVSIEGLAVVMEPKSGTRRQPRLFVPMR